MDLKKKPELIDTIADKTDLSKSDVDKVVSAFTEAVMDAVRKGGGYNIPGFMKIEQVATKERTARNPQTGEQMQIPAGTKTKISALSKLKEAGKAS